MRTLKRSSETLRQLARAQRYRQEHGCGGWPAQQRAEQLDRSRVRPVEVVEDEYQRLRLRQKLK
jgi:hypothetical protein